MRTLKYIFVILGICALILGAIFAVGLWYFQKQIFYSRGYIYTNAQRATEALKNFEPHTAQLYFQLIKDELGSLRRTFSLWTNILPILQRFGGPLETADAFAERSLALTHDIDLLKQTGAQLIIQQKGGDLLAVLSRLRENIHALAGALDDERLYAADVFLQTLIAWLAAPEPQHIVMLFQNSSEIRPAGGFLGSFAHLTLHHGSMTSMEVNDVYDVDGQLTIKKIPPEPLQTITPVWGARDANWFADYPLSARKVIYFLEASRMYQDRDIHFSGAIAININVLKDLLAVVGPISINLTTSQVINLNEDNFLFELQREIETRQNKGILKKATPLLFEKLNQLTDEQKKQLIAAIAGRFANKDIMIYFADPIMESFVREFGVAGDVFPTPPTFFGDYLAIINANIAGGKTDAFITQSIAVDSALNRDGSIENTVMVTRAHRGNERTEQWYNTTNQNFIQVLAPAGAKLVSTNGGFDKKFASRPTDDPDLELTTDKKTFSAWLRLEPGATETFTSRYRRQLPRFFDGNDIPYQFVFDKQSGVDGPLAITLRAPAGFIWKESNAAVFEYKTENPPARVLLKLHL